MCVGPGEVSNLGCEWRHWSFYHLFVSFGVLRETNLGIFAKGNLLLSTSHLPLGVTNEGRELISCIKQISGAVAGDSSLQDRGVAHYLLSFLFSLVSLSFSFYLCVPYQKHQKYLLPFLCSQAC